MYFGDESVQLECLWLVPSAGPGVVQHRVSVRARCARACERAAGPGETGEWRLGAGARGPATPRRPRTHADLSPLSRRIIGNWEGPFSIAAIVMSYINYSRGSYVKHDTHGPVHRMTCNFNNMVFGFCFKFLNNSTSRFNNTHFDKLSYEIFHSNLG